MFVARAARPPAQVFDVAHFIVCLQGERADMGDGFEATTKKHPLVWDDDSSRRNYSSTW